MDLNNEENLVIIDGKEFSLDELSQNAKIQLANIKFVDSQIQQLENQWAVSDTARMAYTGALKNEIKK